VLRVLGDEPENLAQLLEPSPITMPFPYRRRMEVIRCSSPKVFLEDTAAYRELEPIRTNIQGSVATSVVRGAQRHDDHWWWVARDSGGEVVGAAIRTAPFGLQIGPMPVAAAAALAREVATHDDDVPWVVGSEQIVAAFLDAYRSSRTPGSSRKVRRGRCDVIYEAGEMAQPNVEGLSRTATMEDFDIAYQWNLDFMEFIDGVAPSSDERDREALRARLTAGALWFWCVDHTPVSMAGHASRVQTPGGVITRVGPVYTPAGLRHHGYGAAITASLTDSLQREGSRVMLYADATNATSNGVYRRIGYHIVDQVTRYEFGSDHTA